MHVLDVVFITKHCYTFRPSTFAKAAKLKRIANAKEKELIQCMRDLFKNIVTEF